MCYLCFLFWGFFPLQLFPSVLWYCWLGLLTCKNRLPYNLYCVGGDVKHCSIQSNPAFHSCYFRFTLYAETVVRRCCTSLRVGREVTYVRLLIGRLWLTSAPLSPPLTRAWNLFVMIDCLFHLLIFFYRILLHVAEFTHRAKISLCVLDLSAYVSIVSYYQSCDQ